MPHSDVTFDNARATAEAMVRLFGPRVEVVVHDLTRQRIAHIVNPLSQRSIGDPSNLHEIEMGGSDPVIGPYEKVNWDGATLRSISILQQGADGTAAYVICVNHDQADLLALRRLAEALGPAPLQDPAPQALLRNDWHDRLNSYASDWCRTRGLRIEALEREDRRALVGDLATSGVLAERHAAAYVARLLGVSRATVYNDLKVCGTGPEA